MASNPRLHETGALLARKTWALWLLLALQGFCALFFLVDVVLDLMGFEDALGGVEHHMFELIVVLALGFGVVLTSLEIRKVLRRNRRIAAQWASDAPHARAGQPDRHHSINITARPLSLPSRWA